MGREGSLFLRDSYGQYEKDRKRQPLTRIEATRTLIHCRESVLPGCRQHSGCWLVQATIGANQGNPNICTWTIRHEVLCVQSNFQDGPESRGHGTTKSPELALCSPGSKMSTLPTCLLAPHLTSGSWQDFSRQKVDSALFKEHTVRALGPPVNSIRVCKTPLLERPLCTPSQAPAS